MQDSAGMDPGDCPSGLAAPGQPLLKGEWFARPEGVFGDGAIGDALQADSVICEDFEPYNVLVQWDSFQIFLSATIRSMSTPAAAGYFKTFGPSTSPIQALPPNVYVCVAVGDASTSSALPSSSG